MHFCMNFFFGKIERKNTIRRRVWRSKNAFYLENDGFDQGVHRGHEQLTDLSSTLETPQDDATLAEYGEKVQHFTIRLKKKTLLIN